MVSSLIASETGGGHMLVTVLVIYLGYELAKPSATSYTSRIASSLIASETGGGHLLVTILVMYLVMSLPIQVPKLHK